MEVLQFIVPGSQPSRGAKGQEVNRTWRNGPIGAYSATCLTDTRLDKRIRRVFEQVLELCHEPLVAQVAHDRDIYATLNISP